MNAPEKPSPSESPAMSAEASVGIGITVAGLGVLCLLLGWAQHMRALPVMGWIWLVLGVVLLVGGGLAAAFPRSWSRPRSTRSPGPGTAPVVAEREKEPEEQLY